MATRTRVLELASLAFADHGLAATSLDSLAAELGLTKQTILYHFGSKDGLARCVFESATDELLDVLDGAAASSQPGWDRIEATVRAAFALAIRRPELIGLLREVSHLGPPWSNLVLGKLQGHVDSSLAWLDGAKIGHPDEGFLPDPRLVLVSAYSMVLGVIADAELLRAVGRDLDLRAAVGLRRTLLLFLEATLGTRQQVQRRS